jgi:hypothetical protein
MAINFDNDTIQISDTKTDFKALGNVTLEMLNGRIPVYSFLKEGYHIKRDD